ncbi:quinone oxidoreductase [Nephila pilipes]|uniref:Quinone oxidoreductase n=1 Tax=Nephila pilipes TaxID=299642 RepID=A0A8X6TQX8_NEPPI|nr:quinone oxidoreductase [Nephila pilipes]
MNAIRIEKFGPEKVLELKSVEIPKAVESAVVVKVIAAGVNPVDTYIRAGGFYVVPDLPFTLGKDGAGIIHELGPGVTSFKVGERVFICSKTVQKYGTYAEYAVVKEEELFPLNDCLNFEEGAALGVPYFTAYRALVLKARCHAGETVFIHGASGAVGLASVQIAKHLGLKVIGTAGTEEGMSLVKNTGADFVLNHKEKKYLERIFEITDNVGVNIIVEMLANVNLNKDLDILAPRGRLTIVGSRGTCQIDPRKMMVPEVDVIGVALLSSTEEEWEETAKFIIQGIKDGWVKPVIDKKYPLAEACNAHRDIMHSSGAKGKIILSVQDP